MASPRTTPPAQYAQGREWGISKALLDLSRYQALADNWKQSRKLLRETKAALTTGLARTDVLCVGAAGSLGRMDLVPKSLLPIEQFAPDGAWELTEQRFLAFVGARFLSIGESQGPWQEGFVEALRDSEFLGNPPPETGNRRAGRSVG